MLKVCPFEKKYYLCSVNHKRRHAQMAELVDALVSNTSAARHAGSIPALGTKQSAVTFSYSTFSLVYYVRFNNIKNKDSYVYRLVRIKISFFYNTTIHRGLFNRFYKRTLSMLKREFN